MKNLGFVAAIVALIALAPQSALANWGQTLQWHANYGGHTHTLHAGQNATQLMNRCRSQPGLQEASSYSTLASAQSLTNTTLATAFNRQEIERFMQNPNQRDLVLRHWHVNNAPNGVHVTCPSLIDNAPTRWRVVVRKNSNSPSGWFVLTSYPVP